MNRDQALLDAVIAQRDIAQNQAAELMADKHVALARVAALEQEIAALKAKYEPAAEPAG